MKQSPSIAKLLPALVQVQSQVATIPYDSNNTFFNAKYASLTAIMEHLRPLLNANGCAVVHGTELPVYTDQQVLRAVDVFATLLHTSGEWISISVTVPVEADPVAKGSDIRMPNPQTLGKAITYARRYAISALFALVSDEDTDGNHPARDPRPSATKPESKPEPKRAEPPTHESFRAWDGTDSDALTFAFPIKDSASFGKPMGTMTTDALQKFVTWAGVKPQYLPVRSRADAILLSREAK